MVPVSSQPLGHLKFLTLREFPGAVRTRPIPNNNKLVPLVRTKGDLGGVLLCCCVVNCVTDVCGGVLSVTLPQHKSMQARI